MDNCPNLLVENAFAGQRLEVLEAERLAKGGQQIPLIFVGLSVGPNPCAFIIVRAAQRADFGEIAALRTQGQHKATVQGNRIAVAILDAIEILENVAIQINSHLNQNPVRRNRRNGWQRIRCVPGING